MVYTGSKAKRPPQSDISERGDSLLDGGNVRTAKSKKRWQRKGRLKLWKGILDSDFCFHS